MTTAEVKKAVELKPEIAAMSVVIDKAITVDSKAGIATVADNLYADTLPEGLTVETVKAVSDHNTNFAAAAVHAFGMQGVKAMKSNKGLESISLDIPMTGKDSLGLTTVRSKTSHNPQKPDEPITKWGVTTATMEQRAGKNSGQLKIARTLASEYAATALGGK